MDIKELNIETAETLNSYGIDMIEQGRRLCMEGIRIAARERTRLLEEENEKLKAQLRKLGVEA